MVISTPRVDLGLEPFSADRLDRGLPPRRSWKARLTSTEHPEAQCALHRSGFLRVEGPKSCKRSFQWYPRLRRALGIERLDEDTRMADVSKQRERTFHQGKRRYSERSQVFPAL